MDATQAQLATIIKLIQAIIAKPDGTVIAASITVGGMVLSAAIGAFIQRAVTKSVLKGEHQRLSLQLDTEFKLRQFELWQTNLQETIVQLLAETDLEANSTINKRKIIPLVHRAQLLLNPEIPSHKLANDLVNSLAMEVNGWTSNRDAASIFRTQGHLLEAIKRITFQPGK